MANELIKKGYLKLEGNTIPFYASQFLSNSESIQKLLLKPPAKSKVYHFLLGDKMRRTLKNVLNPTIYNQIKR